MSGPTCAGWRRGNLFGKRIDVTFFNIQTKGRQQAANHGEFREVVVGDDRDLKPRVLLFGTGDRARVVEIQLRRQSDVSGDRRCFEPLEVFRIHAAEKILKDVLRNLRAQWANAVEESGAVGGADGHRGQYTRMVSLCVGKAASIMPRHGSTNLTTSSVVPAVPSQSCWPQAGSQACPDGRETGS
jgi:hypothetical protein